jgi:hypothetical protein
VREAAPPRPTGKPALNERRTARPGETVYAERATGSPGARLVEPLTLKNTPAGRSVTLRPEHDLKKHFVDGVPYFCALHALSFGREKRREAAFFICLRDSDGDGATFEEVRIITVVLTIVDREYSAGKVTTTMQRRHEQTSTGALAPKRFTLTTIDPDGGDWYEAAIKLSRVAGGVIEFHSELTDSKGGGERVSQAVRVPVSGPFPVTVSVPHPFEGHTTYMLNRAESEMDRDKREKQQHRAAQLEILGVAGDAVTYRVVRGFMPWRYWQEGRGRKAREHITWHPRPEEESAPTSGMWSTGR